MLSLGNATFGLIDQIVCFESKQQTILTFTMTETFFFGIPTSQSRTSPPLRKKYLHTSFDSRRWEHVPLRPDDIIISTSLKSGTTWMQAIVANLLWSDEQAPAPINELSPWVESHSIPVEQLQATLAAQTHRRILKSHCPPDGLPWNNEVRYIVVGRNGKDVFMSLVNHHDALSPSSLAAINERAQSLGFPPFQRLDMHKLFDQWINQGALPDQKDGAPYWSALSHIALWWERQHTNVLFVHYDDLLEDLDGEMHRVAQFLEVNPPADRWPTIVDRCRFDAMKDNFQIYAPERHSFEGDGARFFHQGRSKRWEGVLTPEELARYDERVAEVLPEDAAIWLDQGRSERILEIDPNSTSQKLR
jgi:aryl sulfotransferase